MNLDFLGGQEFIAAPSKTIKKDSYMSKEEKEKIQKDKETVENFYQAQSWQMLGSVEDRVQVPIWIDSDLDDDWKKWLKFGIKQINTAAPGLFLIEVSTENVTEAKILVKKDEENPDTARTKDRKNIIIADHVEILLGEKWPAAQKKRTATHELLHALGFKHEQERKDAGKYIHIPPDKVKANNHIIGISRFDPFSIMLYGEKPKNFERKDTPVWKLKQNKAINDEMSELDKVGLNLLYRPCKGPEYQPKISPKTQMLYCGREVMEHHNRPAESLVKQDRCGLETSANCPACRTIKTDKVQALVEIGKWQGWSGMVYCKKEFGPVNLAHSGFCGANNGLACPECREFLKI